MPGPVCRIGDKNAAGGVILTGVPTVLINGRPAAVLGNKVGPHAKRRGALTTSTNKTVLVLGKPIVTVGDLDTSGFPRLTGSTNVIVGV